MFSTLTSLELTGSENEISYNAGQPTYYIYVRTRTRARESTQPRSRPGNERARGARVMFASGKSWNRDYIRTHAADIKTKARLTSRTF